MSTTFLRPLGKTGLAVSRLGLGLAALGRPGYVNVGHAEDLDGVTEVDALAERTAAVLDAALEAGIRYVDVARSYGRGEEFLARWLARRGLGPRVVTVGSKWGYRYTAEWRTDAPVHEEKAHDLERLERQLAESRDVLGAHLALYQIHSATEESGVLERRDVLERLATLRDDGLAIGLTVTGPRQADVVRRAIELEVGGRRLFGAVQATWNLLEPSVGPALAEAKRAGMGVIVKEPLANGRLTDRNADPAFASRRRVLEEAAATLGTTVDAFALAAALRESRADVVLSGAATVAQLRSNVAALALDPGETVRARLPEISEPPAAYWANRSRLPWT